MTSATSATCDMLYATCFDAQPLGISGIAIRNGSSTLRLTSMAPYDGIAHTAVPAEEGCRMEYGYPAGPAPWTSVLSIETTCQSVSTRHACSGTHTNQDIRGLFSTEDYQYCTCTKAGHNSTKTVLYRNSSSTQKKCPYYRTMYLYRICQLYGSII